MKFANNNLKKIRKSRGLTLRALAEKAGSSKSRIFEVEKGAELRLSTAYGISNALGLEIGDIWPNPKENQIEGSSELLETAIGALPAFPCVGASNDHSGDY